MARKKKKHNTSIFPIFVMLFAIAALAYAFFGQTFFEPVLKNKKFNNVLTNKSSDKTGSINDSQNGSVYEGSTKNLAANSRNSSSNLATPKAIVYAPQIPFNEYQFKYTYDIDVKGNLKTLNFKMYVPNDEPNKYTVKIKSISQKPNKYYKAKTGYIAEYNFNNISNQRITISMAGLLKTRTYDLALAKEINRNLSPEKDLSPYLRAEKYLEVNDDYIQKLASKITGSSQEEIVNNIYKFVQKTIKYKIVPNIGAKQALKKNYGKCSEFSAAMIALCRAKNIPARVVAGDFMREYNTAHAWVEVYYDKYGWVMYDPTHIENTVIYRNGKKLGTVNKTNPADTPNDYMVLRRNDIDNHAVDYTFAKNQTGSASINKKFEIKKLN